MEPAEIARPRVRRDWPQNAAAGEEQLPPAKLLLAFTECLAVQPLGCLLRILELKAYAPDRTLAGQHIGGYAFQSRLGSELVHAPPI